MGEAILDGMHLSHLMQFLQGEKEIVDEDKQPNFLDVCNGNSYFMDLRWSK